MGRGVAAERVAVLRECLAAGMTPNRASRAAGVSRGFACALDREVSGGVSRLAAKRAEADARAEAGPADRHGPATRHSRAAANPRSGERKLTRGIAPYPPVSVRAGLIARIATLPGPHARTVRCAT